ncbi:sirohydrochlorin chelatase [Sphaerisporangium sp. TRM90804]|uniref:sirohydrochlorin chelatase n=1 Tax=Sphaerisporangium sp. TRM90804 TaxID=3031113 RepID=UPI00244D4B47|nr:sirohydrochlorin chelatase [Sphaerisporangium sp. TRM90804]MDH2424218.1 sirohydrochlorin chelatase [Sphaerisporangium sp. TRM90804]
MRHPPLIPLPVPAPAARAEAAPRRFPSPPGEAPGRSSPSPAEAGHGPPPPLVAVAHGSRDPRASATVQALLDAVRLASPALDVHEAYLDHTRPSLGEALRGLEEAVVLPLLLTEAYHSRVDIPAVIAEAGAGGHAPRVHQGATLGPHPLLVTALERRLREAGVEIGDPGTAVVLVSAGSSDRRANAVVAEMARDWSRARPWHSVTPAYASAASPTPEQAVRAVLDGAARRRRAAPRVVVAPYLLACGHFADKTRRTAMGAGAHTVADPLGPAPELVAVLLSRYAQAVRAFRAAGPAPARA